jgi:hypothetical protein
MDNDVLELAAGIGAWISVIFLISAYMIAEENQVQSDELTKAYIGMILPLCIMMILYILFQLVIHIGKLVWWILMLMTRSDILAIAFGLILLNLLIVTINHTVVLLNDQPGIGIRDEL